MAAARRATGCAHRGDRLTSRWRTPALASVLAVAAGLRALRVIARWHEDAWLYAAYPSDTVDALALRTLPATFTGLHPPAWPLLHALTELLLPVPLVWLLTSAMLSTAAVALLARRSLAAALVLATAPVAVHYAAEVNQYALLTFALAGLWTRKGPRSDTVDLGLIAWGALAGWTHILGAVAAVLALSNVPRSALWRTSLGLGLALLPLCIGVMAAVTEPSTFSQPPLQLTLIAQDWSARFGLGGLLLVALLLRPRRDEATVAVIGTTAVIGIFIISGVAAPHQFPYWLVPLPALALLAQHTPKKTVLVGLCVVQAGWQFAFDGLRVTTIHADQATPRAVDQALAELDTPWTCTAAPTPECTGDAVVMLRAPGLNDDDKNRTSSVLWRIKPWWMAPRALPSPTFDWSDHRNGQPRLVELPTGRHVVYVHDHLRPSMAELTLTHPRVWVVVSAPGAHREYTHQLSVLLKADPETIGADHLYRLSN